MAMPVASPDLERWRAEARALPSGKPIHSVPFSVLLDEAAEAAVFFRKYWQPAAENGAPLLGLESVAG